MLAYFSILIFNIFQLAQIMPQGGPDPGGDPDPGIPIVQYVVLLVIGAVGYGAKSVMKKNKS